MRCVRHVVTERWIFTFDAEKVGEGAQAAFVDGFTVELSTDEEEGEYLMVACYGVPATSKGKPDRRARRGLLPIGNYPWRFRKIEQLASRFGFVRLAAKAVEEVAHAEEVERKRFDALLKEVGP